MANTRGKHYEKEDWVTRLQMLSAKFSHLGANDDIPTMGEDEQWGLYCCLQKQVREE